MFKFFCSLLLTIYLSCATVFAAGITHYEPFMTAAYWVEHNPDGDRVLLNEQQLADYNAKIRAASPTVVDIANYPETVAGDLVKSRVSNYAVLEDELFLNGKAVSENYKNILRTQSNVSKVPDVVNPKFGVIVRRTSVRNLPTAQPLYYYQNDTEFDALQETMLEPGEPVAVLHTSENGYLYFVQAGNYYGWVSKYNVGLCSRKKMLRYAKPSKFVVVTDEHIDVTAFEEKIFCQMGCRLPYVAKYGTGYKVSMPGRNKKGKLVKDKVVISAGVHEGYLPYTENNLLRLAFKFNGMPYGWGGLKESVDCSGLLNCIYRTVGVCLPRNANEQEATYGTHYDFKGLSSEQRLRELSKLHPSAALFMPGHCMVYIGSSAQVPYIIHAAGSHFKDGKKEKIMQVVISDLSLLRANGKTFLDNLTQAVEYH